MLQAVGPPSEPRAAAAETRAAILEAASRRYARFGPRKTTMDEVARETRSLLEEVESAVASSGHAPRKLREIVRATPRIYADRPVLHGALRGGAEMALERVAVRG